MKLDEFVTLTKILFIVNLQVLVLSSTGFKEVTLVVFTIATSVLMILAHYLRNRFK